MEIQQKFNEKGIEIEIDQKWNIIWMEIEDGKWKICYKGSWAVYNRKYGPDDFIVRLKFPSNWMEFEQKLNKIWN